MCPEQLLEESEHDPLDLAEVTRDVRAAGAACSEACPRS